MLINSLHERIIQYPFSEAGILIDTLADNNAILWPSKLWPRESFNGPLKLGTVGAHGGTRYVIETYKPGKKVVFRFTSPHRYKGFHSYEILSLDIANNFMVRHITSLELEGIDLWIWRLSIQWVHDALIEDGFDQAEKYLTGQVKKPNKWKYRVYILRYSLGISRLLIGFLKGCIKKNKV